jgi:hypothetical protein
MIVSVYGLADCMTEQYCFYMTSGFVECESAVPYTIVCASLVTRQFPSSRDLFDEELLYPVACMNPVTAPIVLHLLICRCDFVMSRLACVASNIERRNLLKCFLLSQKSFVAVMETVLESFGESMPHQHDTHPADENLPDHRQRKRERVYIPCGLVSNKTDLVSSASMVHDMAGMY